MVIKPEIMIEKNIPKLVYQTEFPAKWADC